MNNRESSYHANEDLYDYSIARSYQSANIAKYKLMNYYPF